MTFFVSFRDQWLGQNYPWYEVLFVKYIFPLAARLSWFLEIVLTPLLLSSSLLWLKWPSFIVNCHLQSVFRWRDSRNVFPNARSQNVPNVRSREKVANTWYCIVCLFYCCVSQGSNETGLFNQISTALYSSELAHSEILGKRCVKVMCLIVRLVPALNQIWEMA